MYTCSNPFNRHLVPNGYSIGHGDLRIGRCCKPERLASENGGTPNERDRIHAILYDGMFSIVVLQRTRVTLRLSCQMLIVHLQMRCGILGHIHCWRWFRCRSSSNSSNDSTHTSSRDA